jgi:outer membrane autotransporter protein
VRAVTLFRPLFFALIPIVTTGEAFAQAFTVTIEEPGVQQSSLSTNPAAFGATNVIVETFDELKAGFVSKPVPFAGGHSSLGSYDHLLVRSADAFGGAGGKGTYMSVNSSLNAGSNPTTLVLATPQRYFGLWWSAGDPNNVLSFYSGNTLLETFRTSDVINFINAQANKTAFFGNPNSGQNKGEPYAFLNFYVDPSNPGLTFDRIVFSSANRGSGFELDNHTIATFYTDVSGMDISPDTPVDLGAGAGTTDTIGVEGPGSELNDSGTAVVGGSGSGTLDVIDGAKVSDGATEIGQNPGSTGDVEVNGKGSSLNDTGNAMIGEGGKGVLDITEGGTVTDKNAVIGDQPGSSGVVVVDGSGSQWDNSGSLDVGKAGSGTLEVADGGTVVANGGTTVGSSGEIMGDGVITTPMLINDGVLMPMGPKGTPGALTENGNYQQGASGVLDIGIAGAKPSQADQLKVNGAAKLGGTLELMSLSGFHVSAGDAYEVISTTGGTTGKFTGVMDEVNTTGLTRADIIAPNGVLVVYLPPGRGALEIADPVPLPANALTELNSVLVPILDPNVAQLVAPFDIWFSLANTQRFNLEARFDDVIAGSTGFVSNMANFPAPALEYAVNFTDPTEGKGVGTGKETKQAPLAPAPGRRWGVWVTGYGDFVNVGSDAFVKGYNYTTGGVTIGTDYHLTDHFVVGLMCGYAHTWTNLKPGSVDVDTGWGGLYSGYFNRGFYVLGAAFGGGSSFATSRAALQGFANGSSASQQLSTFLSAGYDCHFGRLTIGPAAAVQYSYVNINSFSEHGSVAPVTVAGDSEESWRTDLGFRAWYNFQIGRAGVRPFLRAAWEHEYKESRLPITAGLVGFSGPPTTVFGPSLGHDSAVVNAGFSVQWTPCISTYVSYDGQLGRDRYDSNGVSGGFQISF